MKVVIKPSILSGHLNAPPSKSYTHRAIILASLARGCSEITNALISDDTRATIEACKLLGVKIKLKGGNINIEGVDGQFPTKNPITINCAMSGTTLRLLTAVSVLSKSLVTLTGDRRLKERPVEELIRVLKSLGVDITGKDNKFPPIKMKGGDFFGGEITISGKISSQFISALLLIAPFAKKDTEIKISNLKSAPYVDITIDMMTTFGVKVERNGNKLNIKCGQHYQACSYSVEGDYSSASYFFAAAYLTNSKIYPENLKSDSVQGDKYFSELLSQLKNTGSKRVFDLGNYPDIVPTIAICAANINGQTKITNIGHLREKETDRISAVSCELQKMGIKVIEKKESLIVYGGRLKGAIIDTYNDHRIAMSFAVAGLAAKGKTIINNAEVVNKSYPNFWQDFKKIGANIEIINTL